MSSHRWPLRKTAGNRLTAMMQVRNEAGRYLEQVLEELSEFVDDIVVVDDGSTDHTAQLCRSFAKVTKLVTLETSLFNREWELRQILWDLAVSTNPDWLLSVDADEFYEEAAKREMRRLIDQDVYDWVSFRLFDFWGAPPIIVKMNIGISIRSILVHLSDICRIFIISSRKWIIMFLGCRFLTLYCRVFLPNCG